MVQSRHSHPSFPRFSFPFLSKTLFGPGINSTGVLYAEQALLSCLGSGRRCALIVHSGDSYTYVVPVVRGTTPEMIPEPLLYAALSTSVAGRAVSNHLAQQLGAQGHHIEDSKGRAIPLSWALSRPVLDDIKESLCFVSLDFAADLQSCLQSSILEKTYDLENGDILFLGRERFLCSEILFQHASGHPPPVQDLVRDSISLTPPELQAELWGSIVLSGGNTLLPGYAERLAQELAAQQPGRSSGIVALPERRLLPWIGGAIFATMETVRSR